MKVGSDKEQLTSKVTEMKSMHPSIIQMHQTISLIHWYSINLIVIRQLHSLSFLSVLLILA